MADNNIGLQFGQQAGQGAPCPPDGPRITETDRAKQVRGDAGIYQVLLQFPGKADSDIGIDSWHQVASLGDVYQGGFNTAVHIAHAQVQHLGYAGSRARQNILQAGQQHFRRELAQKRVHAPAASAQRCAISR